MTQKRFVYYEHKGADYILDTPNKSLDFIEMLGDCLETEEIVDLLNQLSDENEQLRKENDMFSCELSVSANKEISRNCRIVELEEENEQLKQFKEKVFTLIDKEIARNEEAIEWGKETGADSNSIGYYNQMLNRLKKELSE